MPTRILFVDDDAFLLQAQRRLLWSVKAWKTTFCDSGQKALEHMAEEAEREPFDVVISDMRMPEMNGAELFREIRRAFPSSIRIMLSGQTESGSLCRVFGPSHQYLQKPCPPDELRRAVDRSVALHERLDGSDSLATIRQLGISDIVESRREIIRACRMTSVTAASFIEQIAPDGGWSAALESIARLFRPEVQADRFDLSGVLELFELSQIRTLAAAACVFAHLCEEFSPSADMAQQTLEVAVQHALNGQPKIEATSGWDVAQWARGRSEEETTLANLLHNVANLLPFRHHAKPQHLSAALLEQLGLPHSVVASVTARCQVAGA